MASQADLIRALYGNVGTRNAMVVRNSRAVTQNALAMPQVSDQGAPFPGLAGGGERPNIVPLSRNALTGRAELTMPSIFAGPANAIYRLYSQPRSVGYDNDQATADAVEAVMGAQGVGMAGGAMMPRGPVGSIDLNALAYHGSPHKFDKFSMEKIGTGEGAQAYGHGLYFAEDPAVAQQYAEALATHKTTVDGKEVTPDMPEFSAIMSIAARGYAKALADAKASLASGFVDPAYQAKQIEAIERIGPKAKIKQVKQGNTYTVDIPDEHIARMLDWDKPLSDQPEIAQQLIGQMQADSRSNMSHFPSEEVDAELARQMKRKTGWDLYNWLSSRLGSDAEASRHLQTIGIPGIRYLDGGSRGAGQGTSNFVLFDDSLPTITHINGQPVRR